MHFNIEKVPKLDSENFVCIIYNVDDDGNQLQIAFNIFLLNQLIKSEIE